jgi:hypothetical protein
VNRSSTAGPAEPRASSRSGSVRPTVSRIICYPARDFEQDRDRSALGPVIHLLIDDGSNAQSSFFSHFAFQSLTERFVAPSFASRQRPKFLPGKLANEQNGTSVVLDPGPSPAPWCDRRSVRKIVARVFSLPRRKSRSTPQRRPTTIARVEGLALNSVANACADIG